MVARFTIERILRDSDDASAQTVREWRLQLDCGHIQIARNEHSDWLTIRTEDVPALVADLQSLAAREAGAGDGPAALP